MSDNSRAYNSVWQLRGDAWCRLEEASDRLTKPAASGELKEEYVAICRDLLTTLTPLEPYWAYPGMPQFSRVSRLFSAGSYDKFAHAVSQINWALTTESYRVGRRRARRVSTSTTSSEPIRASSSTSQRPSATSRTSRCWSSSR